MREPRLGVTGERMGGCGSGFRQRVSEQGEGEIDPREGRVSQSSC